MTPTIKHISMAAFLSFAIIGGADVAADALKDREIDLLQLGLAQGDTDFPIQNVAPAYVQHNPGAPDRRDGLLGFVGDLQSQDTPIPVEPHRMRREGNLVLMHSSYEDRKAQIIFDQARMGRGLIVERRDSVQPIPVVMTHDNGMS